jgi:hypothetical protein
MSSSAHPGSPEVGVAGALEPRSLFVVKTGAYSVEIFQEIQQTLFPTAQLRLIDLGVSDLRAQATLVRAEVDSPAIAGLLARRGLVDKRRAHEI